jgi:hypothetical protein
MKIVNLKTFLTLPRGTVFCRYQPCCFDGLEIKECNYGDIDFGMTALIPPWPESSGSEEMMKILDKAEQDGQDFPLDFNSGGRDGCFQEDQLFAIFSQVGLSQLIRKLQKSLTP